MPDSLPISLKGDMNVKKYLAAVFILILNFSAFAQDNTIKTLQDDSNKKSEEDTAHKKGWKTGGLFTLNVAQGSLSNWQGGGDKNSFSAPFASFSYVKPSANCERKLKSAPAYHLLLT